MIISFDLDETLISRSETWPAEDALRSFGSTGERLRTGVTELFRELRERGYDIWLYTNSYRGWRDLEQWFEECGLPVDRVINQVLHDETRMEKDPGFRGEKCPGWFGVDLHIDDHELPYAGCRTVRLDPSDEDWVRTVIAALSA